LASEEEQAKALESSGFNNQAYKVLSDEDARIQYILDEFGLLKDDKEAMPPDFLMKMMVFNEAISDLEDDPSSFSTLQNDLIEWENELKSELDYCASFLPLDIENARHLKTYFFKRKYYLRIQDNFSKFAQP
jgi:molecular chaperone HscB